MSLHWLRPPMPQFRVGDTHMLVPKNAKICVNPNINAKVCVTPNANPQRAQVEYRWHWVPKAKFSRWPCRLLLFVSLSLTLGSQHKHNFQWNMGYRFLVPTVFQIHDLPPKMQYSSDQRIHIAFCIITVISFLHSSLA